MSTRTFLSIVVTIFATTIFYGALKPLEAQTASALALTGLVSAQNEMKLEGVLVTARLDGAAHSVTVVSNEDGQYSFPRSHLKPGRYTLQIRAAGYDIDALVHRQAASSCTDCQVDVESDRLTTVDLRLRKTADLAAQLTSLEWVMSAPGTPEQKDGLVRQVVNCGFCHTLERVVRTRYTAEQWVPVIKRMATYHPDFTGSTRIQKWSGYFSSDDMWWNISVNDLADYLASINLSTSDTWTYPLKTLPRPKGSSTQMIVTVYDIPRQPSAIHDLDVDSKGNVWYGNTGHDYIGKLDPKTSMFTEYAAPNFSPPGVSAFQFPGAPPVVGLMDVQVDPDDKVWAVVQGSKLARFDPETLTWDSFDIAPGQSTGAFLAPFRQFRTVWTHSGLRVNVATGKVDVFNWQKDAPAGPHTGYVLDRDSQDNGYLTDYGRMGYEGSYIVRIEAETGAVKFYPTPTSEAFPRRGYIDSADRFWFSEFFGDKIGMFDTRTEEFKEFPVPHQYSAPYYARPDRNGDVWSSSNGSDRLLRLDPDTGKILEYLMPVYYDARKVVTDPSADRITIWLPNKNTSQLIRVEILE